MHFGRAVERLQCRYAPPTVASLLRDHLPGEGEAKLAGQNHAHRVDYALNVKIGRIRAITVATPACTCESMTGPIGL